MAAVRTLAARLMAAWDATGDKGTVVPQLTAATAPAGTGALELLWLHFPQVRGRATMWSPPRVFGLLAGTFTALFATLRNLGWNDLAFQTAGTFDPRCSRASAAGPRCTMSNHGRGLAIDLNSFENDFGGPLAAMDPRVVAAFEGFGFRWGKSLPKTDPMHFEFWLGTDPPPAC
jgi:hypothetical protein